MYRKLVLVCTAAGITFVQEIGLSWHSCLNHVCIGSRSQFAPTAGIMNACNAKGRIVVVNPSIRLQAGHFSLLLDFFLAPLSVLYTQLVISSITHPLHSFSHQALSSVLSTQLVIRLYHPSFTLIQSLCSIIRPCSHLVIMLYHPSFTLIQSLGSINRPLHSFSHQAPSPVLYTHLIITVRFKKECTSFFFFYFHQNTADFSPLFFCAIFVIPMQSQQKKPDED